jgi:transposase
VARPSKLTDAVITKLAEAIRLGATYEIACKYAGVTYQTLRNWIIDGETAREGSAARNLRDKLEEAEGRGAVQWLAVIEKAAKEGTWQAAAWKLERRYNKDYGNRTTVDFNLRQEVKELAKDSGIPENVIMAEIEELVRK